MAEFKADNFYAGSGLDRATHLRGDRSWLEQDVLVFARSFRALRINAIRSSLLSGVALGKRLATAGGSPDRIKKVWRRRISTGGSSGGRAQA